MNEYPNCPVCDRSTTIAYDPALNTRIVRCNGCKWSERLKTVIEPLLASKLLPLPEKAATDKVGTGLVMIPWYSILRIGAIFVEGLRYGRDNWKRGVHDKEYQEERLEHAMLHLIKWKEGDRSEDHLAKVAWFCVTQMELGRLETTPTTTTKA